MIELRWFTSNKSKKVFHLPGSSGKGSVPVGISHGIGWWSANPVKSTICRLSFYRMERSPLTGGGKVSSYWHHGVECEYTGMAEEINLCFNICTPLCAVVYGYLRSCRGYWPMLICCSFSLEFITKHSGVKKCEMRCFFPPYFILFFLYRQPGVPRRIWRITNSFKKVEHLRLFNAWRRGKRLLHVPV